jgi:hypothetical protein
VWEYLNNSRANGCGLEPNRGQEFVYIKKLNLDIMKEFNIGNKIKLSRLSKRQKIS